jgi:putative isomerase
METIQSSHLRFLRDKIDPINVPFSDRGSRLLIQKYGDRDQLYIKLAERLKDLQPGLETYLFRPPYIKNLCFIDEAGMPLACHLTTYPHAMFFQTRLGRFGLTFDKADTIAIGLPSGVRTGIQLHASTQIWQEEEDGGSLRAVRNLAYHTNGKVIKNDVSLTRDDYFIEFIVDADDDTAIHLNIRSDLVFDGAVVPFSQTLASAEKRWHEWFDRVPKVIDPYQLQYYYAWWVMSSNLVSPLGRVEHEAMMPSKVQYVGVWNWDACFHALAFRHLDPELARDQLRTIIACQLPDGMIPDAVYDEGVVDQIDHPNRAEVTKPPVIAWSALKLHETDPNPDFLEEIYIPLVRWNAWWFSMNDDDADGLAQYNHPYSSGLDDSPLFDHGLPVESPDLNTYLCVQMGSLALIAEALGMVDEAGMWRRRASALVQRMIKDFYDEEAGIFWATHDHKPILEMTLFNLYPLWTGQLPTGIKDRLIAHLSNRHEFWADHPLATVARNIPSYDPDTMWRGPTWANINYIFIEALRLIGRNDLANQLRDHTLNLIAMNDGIHEFYNPETGYPGENAVPMFGWTAAVFIDLAVQLTEELGRSERQK